MAVTVTHATVTAVPDDPAYDIGSDEWNEAHTVSGLGTAAESAATDFVAVVGDQMTGPLAIDLGTITTSNPAWNVTQTWNDAGVTFTGLKLNVTSTASTSGSLLMDLQTGGTSMFSVRKDGVVASPFILSVFSGGSWIWAQQGTAQYHQNVGSIRWTDGDALAGTPDLTVSRAAANILGIANVSSGGAAVELKEMTAPSAGAANTARIYCEDNGAGKTRLMVLFNSGAAQQIAIEP